MLICVDKITERSTKFPPNKGGQRGVSILKKERFRGVFSVRTKSCYTPPGFAVLPFLGETFKTQINRIQKSTLTWQS